MICSRCFGVFLRKPGPAGYMGGYGGARKSQLGVYRDAINSVSARKDGKYFRIKSALRGEDDFN